MKRTPQTFRRGVGAREASGGETTLDVLSVELDEAGALVSVRVYTEALTGCPDRATVVARNAGGSELARSEVALDSDYPFFGLVSIETPCAGRGQIRLEGATTETEISFEVSFGGEVYATGPGYRVGDLMSQPPPPAATEDGPLGDTFESAVSGAVQPIVTGAVTIGGGYLLLSNLDTIAELLSD